jgi:hypothetical protein
MNTPYVLELFHQSSLAQRYNSFRASWENPRAYLLLVPSSWCTSHQYALLKRG